MKWYDHVVAKITWLQTDTHTHKLSTIILRLHARVNYNSDIDIFDSLCIVSGILERPIRTCRVKSGGINKLCEVDKNEFHQMLLSNVHAETSHLKQRGESHHVDRSPHRDQAGMK